METRLRVENRGSRTFGRTQWWPLNDLAKVFCKIAERRTLDDVIVDMLISIGYSVEYYGVKCAKLDSRGATYLGYDRED
jgi:hypothetical protein